MKKEYIIGTRGSRLALSQTELVIAELQKAAGLKIIPKVITTEGDRSQDLSLRRTTGEGVFVREIESALLRGEIDLAAHSLKDLPVTENPDLTLKAFLKREDPREAFLDADGASFEDLPRGAVIGTSSLRRMVQLQRIKPDCQFRDIRGNIDTRVRKMEEGQYHGIVLAVAGLKRLGLEGRIRQIFNLSQCLPAAGQGVIAVQISRDFQDQEMLQALEIVNNNDTAMAVSAERSFLKELGGGCRLPIGALATVAGSAFYIFGMVADSKGQNILYHQLAGKIGNPVLAGQRLADWFLKKGIIDWN
ncbi:MAG: hydroxymethylbilane synthase [Bacillota bacterium]